MRLQKGSVVSLGAALLLGTAAIGCQSNGNESGGKVQNQTQNETVRPDGTAVQERTRTRQTSSGATVQETETRQRKVTDPGPAGQRDATKADPAK